MIKSLSVSIMIRRKEATNTKMELKKGEIKPCCGNCKYENNSLFREPCLSCNCDRYNETEKPNHYEPKLGKMPEN